MALFIHSFIQASILFFSIQSSSVLVLLLSKQRYYKTERKKMSKKVELVIVLWEQAGLVKLSAGLVKSVFGIDTIDPNSFRSVRDWSRVPVEWVEIVKIPWGAHGIGQVCLWNGWDWSEWLWEHVELVYSVWDWSELLWEQMQLVKRVCRMGEIGQNSFKSTWDWSKVSVEWVGLIRIE